MDGGDWYEPRDILGNSQLGGPHEPLTGSWSVENWPNLVIIGAGYEVVGG